MTVRGIVAGVQTTVRPWEQDQQRRIHNATLEATVVRKTRSKAVIEVRLLNASSGDPIVLSAPAVGIPFRPRRGPTDRRGYIEVGDRVVETGPDGTARVVLDEPGAYEVRYVPESWVTADPAYAPTTTSVRWHPADEFDWWVRTGVRLLEFAIPFVLLAYAARRFDYLFSYDQL